MSLKAVEHDIISAEQELRAKIEVMLKDAKAALETHQKNRDTHIVQVQAHQDAANANQSAAVGEQRAIERLQELLAEPAAEPPTP